MTNADWVTTVRAWRERAGLSQRALAERIGATRQAIIAIEAGHRVPSTRLALQLARALGCTVDDLFTLPAPSSIHARLAPSPQQVGHRVALGRVGERWVAHRLPDDSPLAADGLLRGSVGRGGYEVEPLADRSSLESHVLVAGCAPLLGPLVARIGQRFADARGTWLPANSRRALDMLEAGLVHVAGLHLFDAPSGRHNLPIITARFGRQRMRVVALTRWRQGLVLAPGNPLSIRGPQCLQRPEVRFARREPGSGAASLAERLVGSNVTVPTTGPVAHGHAQVARLVQHGVSDTGIAIESVALAAGLDFIPLAEERFDLVVPERGLAQAPVRRILDALGQLEFRADVDGLPGYDVSCCGQVTTLDAA